MRASNFDGIAFQITDHPVTFAFVTIDNIHIVARQTNVRTDVSRAIIGDLRHLGFVFKMFGIVFVDVKARAVPR